LVLVGAEGVEVVLQTLLALLADAGVGEVGEDGGSGGAGFAFRVYRGCGPGGEVVAVGAPRWGVAVREALCHQTSDGLPVAVAVAQGRRARYVACRTYHRIFRASGSDRRNARRSLSGRRVMFGRHRWAPLRPIDGCSPIAGVEAG